MTDIWGDRAEADASPGMKPDVVCRAEDLPFADGSYSEEEWRELLAPWSSGDGSTWGDVKVILKARRSQT